jgi:hypothetical protein
LFGREYNVNVVQQRIVAIEKQNSLSRRSTVLLILTESLVDSSIHTYSRYLHTYALFINQTIAEQHILILSIKCLPKISFLGEQVHHMSTYDCKLYYSSIYDCQVTRTVSSLNKIKILIILQIYVERRNNIIFGCIKSYNDQNI